MRASQRLQHQYRLAITAVGSTLAVAIVARFGDELATAPRFLVLLAALTVLAELGVAGTVLGGTRAPVADAETGDFDVSLAFSFAALLGVGPAAGVVLLAVGAVTAAVRHRRSLSAVGFAAGHSTVSFVGAAVMLVAVQSPRPLADGRLDAGDLSAVVLAGIGLFALRTLLVGLSLISVNGAQWRNGPEEFRHHAAQAAVLLGLAPVTVLVAGLSPVLLPVLLLPSAAVHDRARSMRALAHQAGRDELTGLANRRVLREELAAALGRGEAPMAVLLLDVDRFERLNDSVGHRAADVVLLELAHRLADVEPDALLLARPGGDEFAIVCRADVPRAQDVARAALAAVGRPCDIDGLSVQLAASVGVAVFPDHGTDAQDLLERADVAMHQAKAARSGFAVYSIEADQLTRRRLRLVRDLRRAIDDRTLALYYQPQADLRTGRIVGVEALCRWFHPHLGVVPPSEFVPLAERSGLIEPLTRYVLEEALRQCRRWLTAGRPMRVTVNLAAADVHDDGLPAFVAELLVAHDVDAEWLALEITESMVTADPDRALHVLGSLSAMGVRLALDDFGTGSTSFDHLRRLPVSEVKIDRSFVLNMAGEGSDAVIVRSTIDLARNLGLEVAAEGVETEEVWHLLSELDCHTAQGFHLSRPVPAEELNAWLGQGDAWDAARAELVESADDLVG